MRDLAQRLRESLFFLPAALVAIAAAVAWLAFVADEHHPARVAALPLVVPATVPGARTLLATVAGATITTAAVVFSMTAVAVQLASTQYSPRILPGMFRDRVQRWAIGVVVATFTYSLLALGLVRAPGEEAAEAVRRPSLLVTVAVVWGVASVLVIIGFIDHALRRMRIDEIIEGIATATVVSIRRHYPERNTVGEETAEGRNVEGEPIRVTAARGGWVRSIDAGRLAAELGEGALARVEVRTGEHVSAGDLLAKVWGCSLSPAAVARAVRRGVPLTRFRSVEDDPLFGVRQLVDVALRALSPGVNDPSTAVDVIQHLRGPIRELLLRESPRRVWAVEGGARIYAPEARSRPESVRRSLQELRLVADGQPQVLEALAELLVDTERELVAADLVGRADPLRHEARLLHSMVEQGSLPEPDKAPVLRRLAELANGDRHGDE